jgi:PD-(D/E)XK nuclease superfamily protein
MLTPTQKGSIAEAVIAAEAVKAGVNVLRPLTEGGRYDLVFEIGERFLRVQCKSGTRRGDVIAVGTGTCRLTPRGYVRTVYDASEIDLIAIYCPDTDG